VKILQRSSFKRKCWRGFSTKVADPLVPPSLPNVVYTVEMHATSSGHPQSIIFHKTITSATKPCWELKIVQDMIPVSLFLENWLFTSVTNPPGTGIVVKLFPTIPIPIC
jgi:hypothetical protein